jgi:hypothetical protein
LRVQVQMWASDSASVVRRQQRQCLTRVSCRGTFPTKSLFRWYLPPRFCPHLHLSWAQPGPSAPGPNSLTPLNSGTGPGLTPPISALGLGSSPPTSKYLRPTPFLRSAALPISCRLSVRPFKIVMTGRVRRHFPVSELRTHRRSSTAWLHPVQFAPQMASAGCMLLCTPNQGRPPVLPRSVFPPRVPRKKFRNNPSIA